MNDRRRREREAVPTPEFYPTTCAACGPVEQSDLENFRPWPGRPFWIAECKTCFSTLAVDPVDPAEAEITAVHPSIPIEPELREECNSVHLNLLKSLEES